MKSKGITTNSSILPFKVNIYVAVLLLFIGPLLKSIGESQNFSRGRHHGIKGRGALISAIYQKSLIADLSQYKEGLGKVNNLISVDVQAVQVSYKLAFQKFLSIQSKFR